MKPFTPIVERLDLTDTHCLHIITSMTGQTLCIDEVDSDEEPPRSTVHLDRRAAKWLLKQLKKALKQPKGDVS